MADLSSITELEDAEFDAALQRHFLPSRDASMPVQPQPTCTAGSVVIDHPASPSARSTRAVDDYGDGTMHALVLTFAVLAGAVIGALLTHLWRLV